MKKLFLTLATVLCCTMAMTALSSCGDDDSETEEVFDSQPKKVSFDYTFYNTADMLKYFNIELTYDDGKGKTETKLLTDETANQQVKLNIFSELPVTYKFSRKVTIKDGLEIPDHFVYTRGGTSNYTFYNAKGQKIPNSGASSSLFSQMKMSSKESIAKLFEDVKRGSLDYERIYSLDANGQLVQ